MSVTAAAQTHPDDSAVAAAQFTCTTADTNAAGMTFDLPWTGDCVRAAGGFTADAGSYASATFMAGGFSVSGEQGERLRKVQAGFTKNSLFGTAFTGGAVLYGQRFKYNQARDSSLFAFQPAIPLFSDFGDNLLKYVEHSYGAALFARRQWGQFTRLGLDYSYDVSDLRPLTDGTSDYFHALRFQSVSGPYSLTGIRTSKAKAAFEYNTVDNPLRSSRGRSIVLSAAIAGLGGNVNTVEPTADAKLYYRGAMKRHVIGIHLRGSLIRGYDGREIPPFDRYYMGGEDDIRGFAGWSITPLAFLPSSARLFELNPDGSMRIQNVLVNNVLTSIPVTMPVPIYRLISPGGDLKLVANVEYRIPSGPFTLIFFDDTGTNRLTSVNQVQPNVEWVNSLNSQFPQAGLPNQTIAAGTTENLRMSTGVELQFLLKKIGTPLRFYWAYNPLIVQTKLQTPIVLNLSSFPNAATYAEAIQEYGTAYPIFEQRSMFRFAIGRTF